VLVRVALLLLGLAPKAEGQSWSATAGTITPGGRYTAPATGSARVIFTHNGFRDTTLVVVASGGGTALGVPYGPYGAWSGSTATLGAPFTAGMGTTQPQYLAAVLQFPFAVFVNPFGGGSTDYTTAGVFDLAKWRAQLARYGATHKAAVASAYQAGRLRGLLVLDEPHNVKWGGGLTKAMVDTMCSEVRAAFPGVPVGVTHQYDLFYPGTPYRVCDFLLDQYKWAKTNGDAVAYRDASLAWTRSSGMSVVYSMNILNGGAPDRVGEWDCTGPSQGGQGQDPGLCRITAADIASWGKTLGAAGCGMLMWKQDDDIWGDAAYRAAFQSVADALRSVPLTECKRP
jgi:hypothetical protein